MAISSLDFSKTSPRYSNLAVLQVAKGLSVLKGTMLMHWDPKTRSHITHIVLQRIRQPEVMGLAS